MVMAVAVLAVERMALAGQEAVTTVAVCSAVGSAVVDGAAEATVAAPEEAVARAAEAAAAAGSGEVAVVVAATAVLMEAEVVAPGGPQGG